MVLDAADVSSFVTWGTNPGQGVPLDGRVPEPDSLPAQDRGEAREALEYMDLRPGTPMREIAVDTVFLGS